MSDESWMIMTWTAEMIFGVSRGTGDTPLMI